MLNRYKQYASVFAAVKVYFRQKQNTMKNEYLPTRPRSSKGWDRYLEKRSLLLLTLDASAYYILFGKPV
jgi:hypothetical protein